MTVHANNAARALYGQWFTPCWTAEALVERYFSDLGSGDLVLEPTCGDGSFLGAIPQHIQAVGVEIDAVVAEAARQRTGRPVITGDFRTVPIDLMPTAVIGNPPFKSSIFDGILERCGTLLPDGACAGFILPAYMLQTEARVLRYLQDWSLKAELLPRRLFPRLSKPLVFALFRKGREGVLVGMALYRESDEIRSLDERYRAILESAGGGSIWRQAVAAALRDLGGEASLDELYRRMAGRRPTRNPWWREKVRQVLQDGFERMGKGRYALPVPQSLAA